MYLYPVAGISIFGVYVAAVGSAREHMRTRRKLSLGWLVPLHNGAVSLVNALVFFESSRAVYDGRFDGARASTILFFYYLAKVAALLDTFFLILRKRSRRLTGSHFYSRISPVFPVLPILYMSPDKAPLVLSCATDSLVTSWVYLYYAVASLGLAPIFRRAKPWISYAQIARTGFETGNFVRIAVSRYSGGFDFAIESLVALAQTSNAIAAGTLARIAGQRRTRKKVD